MSSGRVSADMMLSVKPSLDVQELKKSPRESSPGFNRYLKVE